MKTLREQHTELDNTEEIRITKAGNIALKTRCETIYYKKEDVQSALLFDKWTSLKDIENCVTMDVATWLYNRCVSFRRKWSL